VFLEISRATPAICPGFGDEPKPGHCPPERGYLASCYTRRSNEQLVYG